MRTRLTLLASLLAAACADGADMTTGPRLAPSSNVSASIGETGGGAVYTATNDAGANQVVALSRAADGSLTSIGSFPTGGRGIGGATDPLTSQFSVVLSAAHRNLYVVNAGSDEISVFRVQAGGSLALLQTLSSGGSRPVSIAVTRTTLYALNQGSNTVAAFTVAADGRLQSQPAWTRALSPSAAGAAEARVSRDGRTLAVTERGSATIDVFAVAADGSLGQPTLNASHGLAPFGFDFTGFGKLVVSEAGPGTASAYSVTNGVLTVQTASTSTLQRAPCWLIVSPDSRFAYTANAGSATITGFAVSSEGRMTRLDANGITADLGAGAAPLDLDIAPNGRFLYILKAGTGTIGALSVAPNGALQPIGDAPVAAPRSGQMGIAVY